MRPDLIALLPCQSGCWCARNSHISADTRLWLWDRNGNLNAAGQIHHSHIGSRVRSRSQHSTLGLSSSSDHLGSSTSNPPTSSATKQSTSPILLCH
ncbi:hypothetical protein HZ326_27556 [Fusarium oxysporum f. sp. albedinis]|nr:hypothetical protein HZ326_27556 [Fusarium oxysporum f. sp. albedinis]